MTKSTSPTKLSLAELRKRGYMVAVVEKFNPFVKIRQDLWNFGDLLCVHPINKEFLIVQTTSDKGGNVSKHKQKVQDNKNLKIWLEAGGKFLIHGWAKKGKAGKRKLWTLREVKISENATTTKDKENEL